LPGKPTDNAFIESFIGRLQQESLNPELGPLSLADDRKTGVRIKMNIGHTTRWANRRRAKFVADWQQTRTDQKPGF
jgi:transposase InsO family protein